MTAKKVDGWQTKWVDGGEKNRWTEEKMDEWKRDKNGQMDG